MNKTNKGEERGLVARRKAQGEMSEASEAIEAATAALRRATAKSMTREIIRGTINERQRRDDNRKVQEFCRLHEAGDAGAAADEEASGSSVDRARHAGDEGRPERTSSTTQIESKAGTQQVPTHNTATMPRTSR